MTKPLLKYCLVSILLLMLIFGCRKDSLHFDGKTIDRMELIGNYSGHQQQFFWDSSGIENKQKIFEKERLMLSIHPFKNHPNALIINNSIVVYPEKETTTYKELHLIHEQKCQGTESYYLYFNNEQHSLKLIVEKNLICNLKKGRILSIFEGVRIN